MSVWFAPELWQLPLDRPALQARLARVEDQLALTDRRMARIRVCLAQQRARELDTRASEMTLQNMEYALAQRQRQRRALLHPPWQGAG